MHITLVRKATGLGRLYIDGVYQCDTLEDVERPAKIAGETAIPRGTYKVIIDYSNRFKKEMPHVLDVPGFTGVRIHSGNTQQDTEGCILVGKTLGTNPPRVYASRNTFDALFPKIKDALSKDSQGVVLEIK